MGIFYDNLKIAAKIMAGRKSRGGKELCDHGDVCDDCGKDVSQEDKALICCTGDNWYNILSAKGLA